MTTRAPPATGELGEARPSTKIGVARPGRVDIAVPWTCRGSSRVGEGPDGTVSGRAANSIL